MYSNTLTTLYELSKWLQIDPYVFAGVSKANDTTKCGCVLDSTKDVMAEVKNKFWSRQNFEEALLKAEWVFHQIVGEYPAPKLVEEKKPYKIKAKPQTLIPNYLVDNIYRIPQLELIAVANVDKSDLDNLVITFTDTQETDIENLVFYLPQDEATYITNPKWDNLVDQIRPVTHNNRSKFGTSYTVTIPSYLAVKPSLYSNTCLPHEEATYLDTINVYRVVYSEINGELIGYNMADNSDISTTTIGFKTREKYLTYTQVLEPAFSTTDCYNVNVSHARFNYITGFARNEQKLNDEVSYPIYLLAAMFSMVGEDCGCNYNFASEMIKEHRTIPKYREVVSGSGTSLGQQFKDVMSSYNKNPADGYIVYSGFIEAISQLNKIEKWR